MNKYKLLYEGEIWLIRKLKISRNGRMFKKNKFSSTFVAKMFKVDRKTILNIWNSKTFMCKEGYLI